MKRKFSKGLGIGLSLALTLALVVAFAVPVAASPGETINEWYKFDYPAEGKAGDWFRDSDIVAIGPIAEAINGDLYAAIGLPSFLEDYGNGSAEWSTAKKHSSNRSAKLYVPDGTSDMAAVYICVDIKLSAISELSFWKWVSDFGAKGWNPSVVLGIDADNDGSLDFSLADAMEWHFTHSGALLGNDGFVECECPTGLTSTDTNWVYVDVFTDMKCWGADSTSTPLDPFVSPTAGYATLGATNGFQDTSAGLIDPTDRVKMVAIVIGGAGSWMDETVYVDDLTISGSPGTTYDLEAGRLFKSTDGGRTWAETEYQADTGGEPIVNMVCSSIDEDIIYVTDGNYVYKSDDGGDSFTCVGKDSLEEQLACECGNVITCNPITSIDVGYDRDDNPFVFIGTRDVGVSCPHDVVGSVYYIAEAGYPANWTDLNLYCYGGGGYDAFAVGCAPDWADSKETYVVVSNGVDTHVVYTRGTICGWFEFAELLWNCDAANSFGIVRASRIGFPDDWEDTETLFVGVVGVSPCPSLGGDVYMVTDGSAIDLNVAGMKKGRGCKGITPVDIISLDVCGDTDEAALIAGAYCDNSVYYSTDGGWSWDESEKDPTGEWLTYVIWYGDCAESALAATSGCECAFSMSCGEEVGEFWNQISLIATNIDWVRSLGFSPGYVCEETETMFMLSWSWGNCCDESSSLFRYDGTYWERVYLGTFYGFGDPDNTQIGRVYVSPDFNTTNCVYVANTEFMMWRSTDAGCSWKLITFPCAPRPWINSAVVIDEDTVIAGGKGHRDPDYDGAGKVFKTTRHGARPWKEYDLPDAESWGISLALEPGYEDPGTVLLGDQMSQVSISEDGGETWDLVDAALPTDGDYPTWVVFDPGYATNNTIYAAAGDVIARCIIDFDEDWADQEWEEIYTNPEDEYMGIVAAGDTALYVTDFVPVDTDHGDYVDGGVLRSLNPDADDADDVVFERLAEGLVVHKTELHDLFLTCDVSDGRCAENVLWSLDWYTKENVWVYEDTLAAPVALDLPVDGQKLTKTDSATLSWNELCGADCYEVSLYRYCAECPDEKLEIEICGDCGEYINYCQECVEDICIVVDDLEPGTTYYWQVRVCQGQPYLSKWSEERTFTTALLPVPFADLCSPACGAQDIILTPSFSWGDVPGATGYNVELSTTETFTVGVVKGKTKVNAWVPDVTLEYATTYYWRVRAVKDGVYSGWTYCMFTTMAEPVPPPPPVVIEEVPPAPPPVLEIPPAEMITPMWIYAVIGVGAALAVVVIVLIVRTRRPPA